jgi:hypothetical protein
MKRIAALMFVSLLAVPALSHAQTQTQNAQDQSRRGFYKILGGSIAASIGVGVFAAGNNPDAFTGDKSKGEMTAGLAMTGAGAWLMWNGWQDIKAARPKPSIGVYFDHRKAAVVYRRSW